MSDRLQSITRVGPGAYRVVLEGEGSETIAFHFDVEAGDIEVVVWHDDFSSYMRMNLGPAAPLLQAILAFHRAQGAELPWKDG